MKRKFEALRENLLEFVDQDEYPMLVVGCLPDELAYVTKFLQSLEQTYPQHFFAVFPQPFESPAAYMDGVVESIRMQVEAAQPLRAERGDPPFPPIPATLFDSGRVPSERLFGVLEYLKSLLPNEDDHHMVVGFLPLSCRDVPGYARLIGSVVPIDTIETWMAPLRIVAYDDRSKKLLVSAMQKHRVQHVLAFQVDFSTPALIDSMSRDVADPSLPVPERMASLMQLAALDYSYKRYPEALEKYGILYKYYEEQNIPSMQSLCLLGAGDTHRASGQPAEAKEVLQRGIALAMQHKCLPVLLNLLLSITDTSFELKQAADAESYADSGAKVAAAVLNPFTYADLVEKTGDAQLAQNKIAEALASYRRCQELCQMYEHFHRWKSVLGKQRDLYSKLSMQREQREAQREIERVSLLEKHGAKPAAGSEAPAVAGARTSGAHS